MYNSFFFFFGTILYDILNNYNHIIIFHFIECVTTIWEERVTTTTTKYRKRRKKKTSKAKYRNRKKRSEEINEWFGNWLSASINQDWRFIFGRLPFFVVVIYNTFIFFFLISFFFCRRLFANDKAKLEWYTNCGKRKCDTNLLNKFLVIFLFLFYCFVCTIWLREKHHSTEYGEKKKKNRNKTKKSRKFASFSFCWHTKCIKLQQASEKRKERKKQKRKKSSRIIDVEVWVNSIVWFVHIIPDFFSFIVSVFCCCVSFFP